MDNMTVVLPASEIPDGATIKKVKDGVELILRHTIKVHSGIKDVESKLLHSDECFFLVNPRSGDVNTIPITKQLFWTTSKYNIYRMLEDWFEND